MGQELTIPDWAKGKQVASAFAHLNPQEDSLDAGIGQGYGVIGYKGKQWSLRVRGERHNFLDAQGFSLPYIDVVILGQAKTKSKSYYKTFDAATSAGDRPICASMDGLLPDDDVQQKQSETCALCPRNVFKTNPTTGRKGKECTDYKRLALLVLPNLTAPLLNGKPLLEPVFLRVPPDSLNALAIMGEGMANQGFHYSSYITRITFDPNKAHPCMIFRPLQGLADNEAPVILELRNDPTVARITGSSETHAVEEVATPTPASGLTVIPAAPAAPVATSLAVAGLPQPSAGALLPSPSSTPPSSLSGLASAPTATPSTTVSVPSTPPTSTTTTGLVDTGFGGVTVATHVAQDQTAAPAASISDAGEPEESDADMDARIAAMLRK